MLKKYILDNIDNYHDVVENEANYVSLEQLTHTCSFYEFGGGVGCQSYEELIAEYVDYVIDDIRCGNNFDSEEEHVKYINNALPKTQKIKDVGEIKKPHLSKLESFVKKVISKEILEYTENQLLDNVNSRYDKGPRIANAEEGSILDVFCKKQKWKKICSYIGNHKKRINSYLKGK